MDIIQVPVEYHHDTLSSTATHVQVETITFSSNWFTSIPSEETRKVTGESDGRKNPAPIKAVKYIKS